METCKHETIKKPEPFEWGFGMQYPWLYCEDCTTTWKADEGWSIFWTPSIKPENVGMFKQTEPFELPGELTGWLTINPDESFWVVMDGDHLLLRVEFEDCPTPGTLRAIIENIMKEADVELRREEAAMYAAKEREEVAEALGNQSFFRPIEKNSKKGEDHGTRKHASLRILQ